jgi:hypothetical protein
MALEKRPLEDEQVPIGDADGEVAERGVRAYPHGDHRTLAQATELALQHNPRPWRGHQAVGATLVRTQLPPSAAALTPSRARSEPERKECPRGTVRS